MFAAAAALSPAPVSCMLNHFLSSYLSPSAESDDDGPAWARGRGSTGITGKLQYFMRLPDATGHTHGGGGLVAS